MIGLIIVIHVIICILLIGTILVQSGRGGGLIESFSGIESMFGQKTSAFLTRTTTVLSIIFFITCLGLALLAARQSRSLMREIKIEEQPAAAPAKTQPQEQEQAQTQTQQPQTQTQAQTQTQPSQVQEAPKTE